MPAEVALPCGHGVRTACGSLCRPSGNYVAYDTVSTGEGEVIIIRDSDDRLRFSSFPFHRIRTLVQCDLVCQFWVKMSVL